MFDHNPIFASPYEALIFRPMVVENLGVDKESPAANKTFNNIIHNHWNSWLTIFTDASKLSENGNVGVAVWIPKYNIILNYKCPPETSVFTGEATAILEAVLYVESHKLRKSLILSDSSSCIHAILSCPFRSKSKFPIILKIREALYRCHVQNFEVVIAWIPGHSGILGNEAADSCAREAVQSGSLTRYHNYSHDLATLAKPKLDKAWKTTWDTSKQIKGKHFASIQPNIPIKPWFFKAKHLEKRVISTICRLRLGHACSPVHLAKIRVRDSSLCECGLDDGSADHILLQCPNHQLSLYDILPPSFPRPVNTNFLLTHVNTPLVNILSRFIKTNIIKL
ncbi:hypothetical protein JYU34_012513 [Plutella xylostella]|uniref:ribonuclease H n=1 Tax=Plutella xylostella TaxID=51655 RepID=A0ABQ7QCW0_PLUXY|nr:hypothetical protein JYU34_012513 [Plutella xylostella]